MATTTYDQNLMRKRAIELQSQWQTKEQVGNTLNIEKNLWYFNLKTPTQAPTQTPTAPKPTTAPTTIEQPKTTPTLSWVEKLKQKNAHIIAQQWQTAPQQPAPTQQPPKPVSTVPETMGTKPGTSTMDAWAYWMQEIQKQWQMQYENIMKQYNDDIATIKLEEDQTKAKYKNADQVLSGIRAVEDAYKRWIMDPQQIASQTWIPLDQVNQVLRWEAFKSLELQDRATEEERRDLQYKMSQLQTSKSRSIDDLADQAERSKYNYDNQVEDMMRQAWLTQAQMTKMWALTWAIQSSWYRMAIDMIREESKKWLDRLKTVQWWEQDDIAKARTRLLQDFETNTMQIKDYFDRWMNTLRMNGMAQIQQVNQKYWVASQNTVNALKQLYSDMEAQKVSLLNETMQLQQSFNSMWTQEIGILEQRATQWTWDRNKDLQTYLDLYKTNPALANTMFPEFANQINNANFENFDTSLDFTSIPWFAEKYPNQARAKNNNPWGIKTASPALQQARRDAWIQFTTWTPSPANEWWTPYTKFATIGDWLKAQWIALSRQWGDINARLQKWVWTAEWPSYAQTVMWRAWIPQWTTFEQLTPQQQQALQMAVIKKESGWLYNLMTQWWASWTPWMPGMPGTWTWYNADRIPEYNAYFAKWKLPTGMKSWTPEYNQFIAESGEYKKQIDTEIKPHAQNLANMIKEIEDISAREFYAMRINLIWEWQNLRSKYDRILASTALQELINLKAWWATFGALSNQELEFITNASSNLRLRGTRENFKEDLKKMRELLEKWTWWVTSWWSNLDQQQRSPKQSWFVIDPNK